MRRGLSIILGCMLAVTGAMARGGGGGGGARGGGGFGGGRGGGFAGGGFGGGRGGGFAGGGFRGGGFGGGFGGFRGGAFGGRGFNGFNKFGFNRFGFGFRGPRVFFGGFWPGWGLGWSYPWFAAAWWPPFDDCYYDPYSCGYGYPYGAPPPAYPYPYAGTSPYDAAGYAAYNPAPNVTVIMPPVQAPAASPAVIRQYDEYGQQVSPAQTIATPPANAQAPIYLIAFNGSSVIYAAVAYWVDGPTLHYVTLDRKERQAPLNTINRALSYQLNRERRVPFQLPIE
jgi:hypothetical protein